MATVHGAFAINSRDPKTPPAGVFQIDVTFSPKHDTGPPIELGEAFVSADEDGLPSGLKLYLPIGFEVGDELKASLATAHNAALKMLAVDRLSWRGAFASALRRSPGPLWALAAGILLTCAAVLGIGPWLYARTVGWPSAFFVQPLLARMLTACGLLVLLAAPLVELVRKSDNRERSVRALLAALIWALRALVPYWRQPKRWKHIWQYLRGEPVNLADGTFGVIVRPPVGGGLPSTVDGPSAGAAILLGMIAAVSETRVLGAKEPDWHVELRNRLAGMVVSATVESASGSLGGVEAIENKVRAVLDTCRLPGAHRLFLVSIENADADAMNGGPPLRRPFLEGNWSSQHKGESLRVFSVATANCDIVFAQDIEALKTLLSPNRTIGMIGRALALVLFVLVSWSASATSPEVDLKCSQPASVSYPATGGSPTIVVAPEDDVATCWVEVTKAGYPGEVDVRIRSVGAQRSYEIGPIALTPRFDGRTTYPFNIASSSGETLMAIDVRNAGRMLSRLLVQFKGVP